MAATDREAHVPPGVGRCEKIARRKSAGTRTNSNFALSSPSLPKINLIPCALGEAKTGTGFTKVLNSALTW